MLSYILINNIIYWSGLIVLLNLILVVIAALIYSVFRVYVELIEDLFTRKGLIRQFHNFVYTFRKIQNGDIELVNKKKKVK